ncbi:MAG: hypothetical protein GX565_04695 [Lentisphaerae bacterium]|nr:hypothetical protein [Lentisphaerota bacterium]
MRTGIGHGREAALSKYRERLAWLAGNVGGRNDSLLGLCNCGVRAGRSDGQMEREIIDASGTPPLTEKEVRRAIAAARYNAYSSAVQPQRAPKPNWGPTPKPAPPIGDGASTFVDRMIAQGEGATGKTLIQASPVPIPPEPRMRTACFLGAMYEETDYLFCGEQYHEGKIGKNVLMANHWIQGINIFNSNISYPLLIANPLTGKNALTKEGKPSPRCAASVKWHRYALVEFDAMPLNDQCAFWAGVIATGTLPLRSLVYSGGKSLHGLVEIGAADRAQWDKQVETLLFATHNPDAPENRRADRACRNPDRMTRLAGTWRADKQKWQRLVWLAVPR